MVAAGTSQGQLVAPIRRQWERQPILQHPLVQRKQARPFVVPVRPTPPRPPRPHTLPPRGSELVAREPVRSWGSHSGPRVREPPPSHSAATTPAERRDTPVHEPAARMCGAPKNAETGGWGGANARRVADACARVAAVRADALLDVEARLVAAPAHNVGLIVALALGGGALRHPATAPQTATQTNCRAGGTRTGATAAPNSRLAESTLAIWRISRLGDNRSDFD